MQENIQEKYKTLKLTELREIAKSAGIKNTSALRKPQLIQLLCELEVQQQSHETSGAEKTENSKAETGNQRLEHAEYTERQERAERQEHTERQERAERQENAEHQECTERAERHEHQERPERQKQERYENRNFEDLDSGQTANGILEVMADGFGFIRCENYLPGDNDVYVSPAQIRRFNLKTGDIVEGNLKIKTPTEKFSALLYVRRVNGLPPSEAVKRSNFEDMTPIFPNQRIRLETERSSVPMRIVDLVSPIGKGQRGMIVSPPKTGKTTLLKQIAKSIHKNYPDMNMIILLIDERPEEVTDIKEYIEGENVEVIYSTFDEMPDHHKRVSEMGAGTCQTSCGAPQGCGYPA